MSVGGEPIIMDPPAEASREMNEWKPKNYEGLDSYHGWYDVTTSRLKALHFGRLVDTKSLSNGLPLYGKPDTYCNNNSVVAIMMGPSQYQIHRWSQEIVDDLEKRGFTRDEFYVFSSNGEVVVNEFTGKPDTGFKRWQEQEFISK